MNHTTYQQWLVLHALEELPDDEAALLQEHLTSCPSCRSDLETLNALHRVVATHRPVPADEPLLEQARRQRRIALRQEADRPSIVSALIGRMRDLYSPPVGLALGGACVLLIGILIGRSSSGTEETPSTRTSLFRTASLAAEESIGEPAVRNLQFLERDEQTGDVLISFDAVSEVRMRGNINDESIQRVLARSLVSEKNPGTRLRTVTMLTAQTGGRSTVDAEVKSALITAMETDANPAVRKEALEALIPYLPDEDVTRAFVHVLARDQSTGLRIAAVKALDAASFAGEPSYGQVRRALEDAAKSDGNRFIRITAQQAIEENKP